MEIILLYDSLRTIGTDYLLHIFLGHESRLPFTPLDFTAVRKAEGDRYGRVGSEDIQALQGMRATE